MRVRTTIIAFIAGFLSASPSPGGHQDQRGTGLGLLPWGAQGLLGKEDTPHHGPTNATYETLGRFVLGWVGSGEPEGGKKGDSLGPNFRTLQPSHCCTCSQGKKSLRRRLLLAASDSTSLGWLVTLLLILAALENPLPKHSDENYPVPSCVAVT